MNLPSEIGFAAFLQYSPRNLGDIASRSRMVRNAVKSDSYLPFRGADGTISSLLAIDVFSKRLAAVIQAGTFPFLANYFGSNTLLVPIPRSAPLSDKAALWPTMRICQAFHKHGLSATVLPLLERTKAVQKSAFASPGNRPGPLAHFESTRIDPAQPLLLGGVKRITLVDDFVTRGATFVGMYPHITMAFPNLEVCCFALVRTESYKDITEILSPVEGNITFNGVSLVRTP